MKKFGHYIECSFKIQGGGEMWVEKSMRWSISKVVGDELEMEGVTSLDYWECIIGSQKD